MRAGEDSGGGGGRRAGEDGAVLSTDGVEVQKIIQGIFYFQLSELLDNAARIFRANPPPRHGVSRWIQGRNSHLNTGSSDHKDGKFHRRMIYAKNGYVYPSKGNSPLLRY